MVLIASFITFIFYVLALSDGLGYQLLDARIENEIVKVNQETVQRIITAHVKISLNPIMFPVSHLFGEGVLSSDFSGSAIVPPSGQGIGKDWSPDKDFNFVDANGLAQTAAVYQLPKNIPVLFIIGLLIAYLADKMERHIRRYKSVSFPELSLDAKLDN